MTAAAPAWREIILLGEQLLATSALDEQHDLIVRLAANLFEASAELWLDERLFHLPGRSQEPRFASEPQDDAMRAAFSTGKPFISSPVKNRLAFPLCNGDLVMGVLLVERAETPFRKREIEMMEGLVGHASLSLVASHRFAVERWRIEQLTLVRQVSAQIASVLDLEKLTRRVTKLIQTTFQYYYVAVFTREQGSEELRFRSSAGPARGRGKRVAAHLGQGLIGSVAATGEEAVTNDVHTEPRFRFIDSLPETESEAALPSSYSS